MPTYVRTEIRFKLPVYFHVVFCSYTITDFNISGVTSSFVIRRWLKYVFSSIKEGNKELNWIETQETSSFNKKGCTSDQFLFFLLTFIDGTGSRWCMVRWSCHWYQYGRYKCFKIELLFCQNNLLNRKSTPKIRKF